MGGDIKQTPHKTPTFIVGCENFFKTMKMIFASNEPSGRGTELMNRFVDCITRMAVLKEFGVSENESLDYFGSNKYSDMAKGIIKDSAGKRDHVKLDVIRPMEFSNRDVSLSASTPHNRNTPPVDVKYKRLTKAEFVFHPEVCKLNVESLSIVDKLISSGLIDVACDYDEEMTQKACKNFFTITQKVAQWSC